MKKLNRVCLTCILLAGSIILLSFVFKNAKTKLKKINSAEKGFAVVELFTSEGCSSCPSADAAIAKLVKKNIQNTYILSYHVDYWNRLGWKDQFSKHVFSERQQQYARHFSLESIYTPQIIVNGTTQFVGSNESQLNAAIKTGLQNEQEAAFELTAKKKNNSIIITYNIEESNTVILNTALVQPYASTQVKAGENGGKTLNHVNIVRELKAVAAKGTGELTMEIPKEILNSHFQLIAFIQSNKNFKVLGAEQVSF